MALLDEKRDAFVVRIVYDGPPFSGKTTTLRALSSSLGRPLETPEEHDGRTLYFDWLDYTAGRFEGRPIRCQIVSVPGQRTLAKRRYSLLEEADAVVFVADTGRLGIELSVKYARELASVLARKHPPRPGIIVQANKRDVDDALDMPAVIETFRKVGVEAAFIEATATSGVGVREAFLFGVRLALDRVRELGRRGLLKSGRPEIDSSRDLLATFSDDEDASPTASAGSERLGTDDELPDPAVPSGFIWPPVEGRVIVQQALLGRPSERRTLSSGDLYALSSTGWQMHSRAGDVFPDQNAGRSALVDWARMHASNGELLSERRCVVLSPCGHRWRLWQIVGLARSVDDFLRSDADSLPVREVVERLLAAGRQLLEAAAAFRHATVALPVDMMTVAAGPHQRRFVGIMPGFDAERCSLRADEIPAPRILLEPLGKSESVHRLLEGQDLAVVIGQLERIARTSGESRSAAATLAEILAEERAA